MNLSVGIVGLPNVGKSTLFNALLKKQQALAANYPFATIEPNVGIVSVPDERLEKLAIIVGGGDPHASLRKAQDDNIVLPPIKPATVEFVDIAGLVKGASEGAGLGNKFLSHIREVEIITHVVRAFSDENVIKEGSVDPKSDYETIEMELMLADLAAVQLQQSKMKRFQNQSEKDAVDKLFKSLSEGKPVRSINFTEEEQAFVKQLFLLSAKPEIVVINVSEEQISQPSTVHSLQQEWEAVVGSRSTVVVSARIEAELSELDEEEQKVYLKDLGLEQSGLERLIKKAYESLGLVSFLTAGEKEVRAWTVPVGIDAQNAAGVIHTDFIKKFIKAEIVSFNDFVECGGWKGAREKGKARLEGRDYVMKDGDVVEFKIGA